MKFLDFQAKGAIRCPVNRRRPDRKMERMIFFANCGGEVKYFPPLFVFVNRRELFLKSNPRWFDTV
jgi:hypothetical protein